MRIFLYVLGTLWLLPITVVVWLGYVLPALALGWLRVKGPCHPLVLHLYLVRRKNWHWRRWSRWGGLALPHCVITHDLYTEQLLKEELLHHRQWLILGPLFPVVYGLFAIFGYKTNDLERSAHCKEDTRG